MFTFYANTRYGYVKRNSKREYKTWILTVCERPSYGHPRKWEKQFIAEVSFHQDKGIEKFPPGMVYWERGDVSDTLSPELLELKKNEYGEREVLYLY